jgi:hypothetical protein
VLLGHGLDPHRAARKDRYSYNPLHLDRFSTDSGWFEDRLVIHCKDNVLGVAYDDPSDTIIRCSNR